MKNTRLTTVFIAATTASLLMASAVSFAGHRAHRMSSDMNYKGENFKAEVPAPCPPVMLLRDGFYVGIGADYDAYKMEQKTTVEDGIFLTTSTGRLDHGLTGWSGQIFAGYGHYFDTFYLGAEISAGVSNAKSTVSDAFTTFDPDFLITGSSVAHLKARTTYRAGLLPGIKLSDSTLLYVRGDYVRTQFKGDETLVINGLEIFHGHSGKWRDGYDFGVGIETYVAENISARGEYIHANYNTIKSRHYNVSGVEVARTTLSPSNNEYALSLIYHA